jgi:hypothetical protein
MSMPLDARAYLEGLVGQTIPTITGMPNTIVAVRGDDVFVRTRDTANPEVGEPIPIQSVQLAAAFGFKPAFFSVAGGMVPSTATTSLLLITHPGGAKSFDYQDHWDGADLIYTGRGKPGDQRRDDPRNLDVADNRRPLFVFEAPCPRRLVFSRPRRRRRGTDRPRAGRRRCDA